jgi:hypothetical protein
MSDARKPRRSGPSGGKETLAERQERYRLQRAKEGKKQLVVYVATDTPAAIDALRRDREGRGEVIDRLVRERMN